MNANEKLFINALMSRKFIEESKAKELFRDLLTNRENDIENALPSQKEFDQFWGHVKDKLRTKMGLDIRKVRFVRGDEKIYLGICNVNSNLTNESYVNGLPTTRSPRELALFRVDLDETLRTEDDLKKINNDFDFEKVDYVYKTAKLLKNELNNKVPLIGFIGSPWTVATYIIEGNSTKNFSKVLNILKNDKIFLKSLLDMITKASINHLERQIKSGVDVTMIFDTWGGLLEGDLYEEFSLQYINTIHSSLKSYKKPMIYYIRNPYTKLVNIQKLDVDVVGIDSSITISEFNKGTGDKFCVQGNLDVEILKLSNNKIEEEVIKILSNINNTTGHIFNLGTGITPDIDPAKLKTLIDVLAKVSPRYTIK